MYLNAFGKPARHREVAPREFDVDSRWKPAREQNKKGGRRQSRKTEAACVARFSVTCCHNLLTVYQISTAPAK